MNWEQHESFVIEAIKQNVSNSNIAKQISELTGQEIHRGAVCGYIFRLERKFIALGIEFPKKEKKSTENPESIERRERNKRRKELGLQRGEKIPPEHRKRRRQSIMKRIFPNGMPKQKQQLVVNEPDPAKAVPFIDRKSDQCPYPLWGPSEKTGLVCGCEKSSQRRTAYCTYHSLVCEPERV